MSVKVAINGFGRIGRLAFRQMFGAEGYEIVAINDLTSPKMLAHLLKYDSAQGRYEKADTVVAGEDSITVDGKTIKIYAEKDAANLPWGEIGVDVVLECTGFYTSKEKALEKERESLGDTANVVLNSYTESNHPFPASFTVTLTDLEKSSEVISILQQLDKVKKDENGNPCVITKQDTITGLNKVKKGIRIAFFSIGVLLIVISTIIISNTIKLTVHARRREISIMKYVGATNGFIRWPFIVEGMIIGIFASIISIVIVGVAYSFLAEQLVNSQFMQVINMSLISFADMFNSIIFVYMLLGIGIGALGSVISMRKYLKV